MADPPQHPPSTTNPPKRKREDEEDKISKRVRNGSYSAEHMNNEVLQPHTTSRPAQAQASQEHAPAIPAQLVQWLSAAKPYLVRFLRMRTGNIFEIHGILSDANVLQIGVPVLHPGLVFGLRSLSPAQRLWNYHIMCIHGREIVRGLMAGKDETSRWKLVCDQSDLLLGQESAWYASFSHDEVDDQMRLSKITTEQTIHVAVTLQDIEKIVPTTSSGCFDQSTKETSSELLTKSLEFRSSLATSTNNASSEEPEDQTPSCSLKRSLEVTEETDVENARKKARTENIESAEARYETNKEAIDQHWKWTQGPSKALWFLKLARWEESKKIVKPNSLAKTKSVGQPTELQSNTDVPSSRQPTKTQDGTSPDDIQIWRTQHKDVSPGGRKHPLDMVSVPDYPREDTVENSVKRVDGKYECQHLHSLNHGKWSCCKTGLDAAAKDKSCKKAVRAFQIKVEELVMAGKLHIAHKDWDLWYNKKITNEERMSQIDDILLSVEPSGRWPKQRRRQRRQSSSTQTVGPTESSQLSAAQPATNGNTDQDTQISGTHESDFAEEASAAVSEDELKLMFEADDTPWAGNITDNAAEDTATLESPGENRDADIDALFCDDLAPTSAGEGKPAEGMIAIKSPQELSDVDIDALFCAD